ncbi:MarR family winged helix-turn-helix transcriptional regulator [uncultured Methanobrevibacter sp.]|uniref:MarR family winged helix-turn-helix transcriptional regulator n=1 Tax=uncultured Methanobrevibacter sp. TaxID=253161 RepID=UPI0025DD1DD2|nr:MarR family transcriptional regulator [uncultured Methanobrevibacter sp.]MEE1135037.1 MarR family transcriptional regulator [Methanobrevibacter sp.]MEE3490168.1 MarR family transcriptional regulator [Methanobrevibacter sp.]
MIEYDDIIKDSPFLVNHLITLSKTHDFYINKHIKNSTEIQPSQYYMLLFLYYEMGTTQSDIAKACFMDRSGVSRAFKEFEEKGLITREVDNDNKRAYKITLTKKGNATAEFLIKKEKEWDDMICEELNITRSETLELLSKISMKSLKFNREKF